jgi:signal transduction histidine kinase
LVYAKKALQYAMVDRLFKHCKDISTYLSEQYAKSDERLALQYSLMAVRYSDSLTSLNTMSTYSEFLDFDESQRQSELELLKQKYETKNKLIIMGGGIALLLIGMFFLFRNVRLKQAAKLKIEEAFEQLKSTQSQLIQSEKMASLGELTAGIAHEIQNPLNFVNNFSDVNSELILEMQEEMDKGNIAEAKTISNDIKENEEKIKHHGKRADAIVKGMLQHSRSSSGQKEPTDINALCDEYLRLAYHGLRAKDKSFNAKYETNFDTTIEKVNVVPQDIGRVILNLINNAFYAVSEKAKLRDSSYEPRVIVETKKLNGKIEISVKDNGNGIPDAIKEKIFQPFFTTKPTGQGTGLGLSLSYDIITKGHGGELKVKTQEGLGSEFVISLPAN